MKMNKYEEMLKRADEKYKFSTLEKNLSDCLIIVTQMMCGGH